MTAKPTGTWNVEAPRVVGTRKLVVASKATLPAASTARSARRNSDEGGLTDIEGSMT